MFGLRTMVRTAWTPRSKRAGGLTRAWLTTQQPPATATTTATATATATRNIPSKARAQAPYTTTRSSTRARARARAGACPLRRSIHSASAPLTRAASAPPVPPAPASFAAWAQSESAVSEWSNLKLGDSYHGFRLQQKQQVPELNLTAYRLLDPVTGAQAIHIEREDPDQAFCVAFRTPPTDDTGIAHILEHTVLCGSVHFPVRDPFFLLIRRSLKTFMNAMTAADYTMYPFSTLNVTDYYNLLSVYLSCTFFPLLKRTDFQQEGHRLEFEVPDDTKSNLIYKGVVYNEMKGAMSDVDQLFAQRMQSALFTSNVYHHNSGGEPSAIPSLTHDALVSFHAECYHPSNALFLSYGPSNTVPPLAYVRQFVLSQFQANPAVSARTAYVPEPAWTQRKRQHATCPPDPLVPDPDKQTRICVSFVCRDGVADLAAGAGAGAATATAMSASDIELERFSLHILSLLLTDGPLSPMYQALIDSGLGSGYLLTGYDTSTVEPTMSFGLQGIRESDVDHVEQLILSTLEKAAHTGFPESRISSVLHQVELGVRHISSHFGVNLLTGVAGGWAHHRDPIAGLLINNKSNMLQQKLAEQPHYWKHIIQKYLINNKHTTTLIMTPDTQHNTEQDKHEQHTLQQRQKQLSDADKQVIVDEAKQLQLLQSHPTDPSCLPTLRVSDISPLAEPVELSTLNVKLTPPSVSAEAASSPSPSPARWPVLDWPASTNVHFLERPTNGVGYVRLCVDSGRVPALLRPYLPLYSAFVASMGAGSLSYRALHEQLDMYTGGIDARTHIAPLLTDLTQHTERVLFKAIALERNIQKCLQLLQIITTETKFTDADRLKVLLTNVAASLSSSVADSGHSYARLDAAKHLSPAAALNEQLAGITHVQFVNSLVANLSNDVLASVSRALHEISHALFQGGLSGVFVVGDAPVLRAVERCLPALLSVPGLAPSNTNNTNTNKATQDKHQTPTSTQHTHKHKNNDATYYATPIQVNHTALVVPTVPALHPDAPALDLLSVLMSRLYLHTEIREKGGAYGGGSSHSGDGMFAFYSYRDPGCSSTLSAYERAVEWAQQGQFTSTQIDEALLDLFSSIDAPVAPSNQGVREFVSGVTTAQRQAKRQALLSQNKQSVVDVAHRYLNPARLRDLGSVTIIGKQHGKPTNTQTQTPTTRTWTLKTLDLAKAEHNAHTDNDAEVDKEDEHDDDEVEEEHTVPSHAAQSTRH